MGTVIHYAQCGNAARQQRWERMRRAELLDQYRDLQAQGVSQRQAAKVLAVPRTTLQAWRVWQERLDICPQVGTFFASGLGLAIGVDDAEHGRRGQEAPRPVVMGLQKTKEPGPLGEVGKQRPIIACQPPREGSVADAFERMQEPHGDHLAGPEAGLGMFGEAGQLVIDLTE